MLKVAGFVSKKTCSKKIAKISLSDSTIKTLIDELGKTLSVKFSKNYKLTFFPIQCDKTTDIVQLSQLLAYVCLH